MREKRTSVGYDLSDDIACLPIGQASRIVFSEPSPYAILIPSKECPFSLLLCYIILPSW